jgi:uncharacterized membrane protein YphA (DoxX/SURF4 family)
MNADVHWSFWRKQAFRFCASYLSLYILALFVLNWLLESQVIAVGRLLGISTPMDPVGYGSGDTLFQYVLLFCVAGFAVIAGVVWGALDRKRNNYERAQYWFMMVLRYVLGYFMIVYGASKVYEGQFPSPPLSRLLQPYGDSSPMGLAWTFMGASRGYSAFTGIAEMLGGFLLLFRRTRLLGALVCIGVMSNVVAMNFFYDIPVKIFSSHLLLMAIVLVWPDMKRLRFFFFHNRAEPSRLYYPILTAKWERVTYYVLKIIAVLVALVSSASAILGQRGYSERAAKAPLYGIYDVVTFVKNGDTLPPLVTDTFRWRRFVVNDEERATIQTMDDSIKRYDIAVETDDKLELTSDNRESMFAYKWEDTLLVMDGKFKGEHISMQMQRIDHKKFLLTSRGFHWVNPRPFNK